MTTPEGGSPRSPKRKRSPIAGLDLEDPAAARRLLALLRTDDTTQRSRTPAGDEAASAALLPPLTRAFRLGCDEVHLAAMTVLAHLDPPYAATLAHGLLTQTARGARRSRARPRAADVVVKSALASAAHAPCARCHRHALDAALAGTLTGPLALAGLHDDATGAFFAFVAEALPGVPAKEAVAALGHLGLPEAAIAVQHAGGLAVLTAILDDGRLPAPLRGRVPRALLRRRDAAARVALAARADGPIVTPTAAAAALFEGDPTQAYEELAPRFRTSAAWRRGIALVLPPTADARFVDDAARVLVADPGSAVRVLAALAKSPRPDVSARAREELARFLEVDREGADDAGPDVTRLARAALERRRPSG